MDLNLSGWFVEIPAIVNIKILPAEETACGIYVNTSVFKLGKRYLHQNGVEFHQQFIGNQIRGATRQKNYP